MLSAICYTKPLTLDKVNKLLCSRLIVAFSCRLSNIVKTEYIISNLFENYIEVYPIFSKYKHII